VYRGRRFWFWRRAGAKPACRQAALQSEWRLERELLSCGHDDDTCAPTRDRKLSGFCNNRPRSSRTRRPRAHLGFPASRAAPVRHGRVRGSLRGCDRADRGTRSPAHRVARSELARITGDSREITREDSAHIAQRLSQPHRIRCDDFDAPTAASQRADPEPEPVAMQSRDLGSPR
jgi:hypothetical protein